jgi:hypothetical protein
MGEFVVFVITLFRIFRFGPPLASKQQRQGNVQGLIGDRSGT